MSIGENIKELRKSKGMTQTQLAKLLFTSQDTVSLWELNKETPDVKSVIALTRIFRVSSDYILCLE